MPKKTIRYIGEIINNSEILEELHKNNRIYYKVRCTGCNNIREVRADGLGCPCRSCSAKQREKRLCRIVDDLTGRRFGNWLVLGKAEKANFWTCEDQVTGVIKDVFRGSLTYGDSKGSGTTRSWGEAQVKEFLDTHNFFYTQEYSFLDLKSIKNHPLRFDFAIFQDEKKEKLLCLIEYDGRQHFEYKENWKLSKEEWLTLQENDQRKNNYCKNNNLLLYRINYLQNVQNEMERIFSYIKPAQETNN